VVVFLFLRLNIYEVHTQYTCSTRTVRHDTHAMRIGQPDKYMLGVLR
jgi:hypothetical protein